MPYTSKHRLFLTADRARVVRADDPEAAFLFVGAGGQVSDADAARYGLKDLNDAAPAYDAKADHAARHGAADAPVVEEAEQGGLTEDVKQGRAAQANKAKAPAENKDG